MQYLSVEDYQTGSPERLRADLKRQDHAVGVALRELDREKADRWRWHRVAATSVTADFGEALELDVTVGAIVVRLPDGDIQQQGRRVLVCLSGDGEVIVRPISGTINGETEDELTGTGSTIYEWTGSSWYRGGSRCSNEEARVFDVGASRCMYPTIQAAIDAINELDVPPSASAPALVMVWPGHYTMTSTIDVPGWVGIQAYGDGMVRLSNDTTDMFRVTGNTVFFDGLTVNGSTNPNIYVFNCNNMSGIKIRRCDMFGASNPDMQKFLIQSGATWSILNIGECTVDYRGLAGNACSLINTGTAARFVDTWIHENFFDAFALTGFGGGFYLQNTQDVRFWNCTIRGTNAGSPSKFHTGIYLSKGGGSTTGTPRCEVAHCRITGAETGLGGVATFNEAGTELILDNSVARNSLTSGSRPNFNSRIT